MARAVRQVRAFSGFTTLTQTTQRVNLTPFNMPNNSTITRLEGSVHWDFAPQTDTSTTAAALMVLGFAVVSTPELVDVGTPNNFDNRWLWWRYEVLRANVIGTQAGDFSPASYTETFDVHGQRLIVPLLDQTLYAFARLIAPVTSPAVASIRFGTTAMYLLPA